MKRLLALSLLLLALSGCATTGGSRWYAPVTWFSHAVADKADRAEAKVTIAREDAIRAAQKATHETQFALALAGASRPVTVAAQSNDTAVSLLDQAAGPLQLADLAKSKDFIVRLVSENAEIRSAAENERLKSDKQNAVISVKLAEAIRDSQTANDKLRAGFDRENALANDLRASRALHWILGSVAVLFAAGWVYLRFFLGGMPSAIGSLIASAESGHMSADDIREHINTAFHDKPSVLSSIAAAYHKSK